ncbi:hypothetical protein [Nocardioides jishulii]|uniref:Uncharacterized protein n=1 Tax=Nocardioides jishulii TaxID=2575440 RepID=A0A4U2YLR0_9ACTN|nr:hypothetical protein [Nocardioides jishulii]QCX27361.1 hypothetical protein FCL41_07370 [Nocardioides jishulii]TKI62166.1 hypothetical protein FC770_07035 [Nocardioides jishulii]
MNEFDSESLPAFHAWRSGFEPPPDAYAYMAEHLGVASAFFFARLLAPDLVLERGCVLLKDRYSPENFEQWWSSEAGSSVSIERAVNHLHLWDLFEPEGEVEERALEILAARIARSWELHAAQSFPDRDFQVDVTDDYGPTIVMSSRPRSSP